MRGSTARRATIKRGTLVEKAFRKYWERICLSTSLLCGSLQEPPSMYETNFIMRRMLRHSRRAEMIFLSVLPTRGVPSRLLARMPANSEQIETMANKSTQKKGVCKKAFSVAMMAATSSAVQIATTADKRATKMSSPGCSGTPMQFHASLAIRAKSNPMMFRMVKALRWRREIAQALTVRGLRVTRLSRPAGSEKPTRLAFCLVLPAPGVHEDISITPPLSFVSTASPDGTASN
mmetsp:Transcript_60001/g.127059  ORF Transcript_60001/g.127059 Transcript_60001/m.127059 type:complete len:234 (+) Transcript_60001:1924-2625(+)